MRQIHKTRMSRTVLRHQFQLIHRLLSYFTNAAHKHRHTPQKSSRLCRTCLEATNTHTHTHGPWSHEKQLCRKKNGSSGGRHGCLTEASLSKRANSSFRVMTNSWAVHWDARLVKPSMSANSMLQGRVMVVGEGRGGGGPSPQTGGKEQKTKGVRELDQWIRYRQS